MYLSVKSEQLFTTLWHFTTKVPVDNGLEENPADSVHADDISLHQIRGLRLVYALTKVHSTSVQFSIHVCEPLVCQDLVLRKVEAIPVSIYPYLLSLTDEKNEGSNCVTTETDNMT